MRRLVLEDTTRWFPTGSIHIAVVDPGVGTERGIIFARIDRQNYVCPDNGLLSRLARRTPAEKIVRIARSEYWLQPVSATFHGRDIMAPVAARLSLGFDPDRLGPLQKSLVLIDEPAVRELPDGIEGSVLWVRLVREPGYRCHPDPARGPRSENASVPLQPAGSGRALMYLR